MEKSSNTLLILVNYMNEVTKIVELMSKLRKKTNSNQNIEEKMKIKKVNFDFIIG